MKTKECSNPPPLEKISLSVQCCGVQKIENIKGKVYISVKERSSNFLGKPTSLQRILATPLSCGDLNDYQNPTRLVVNKVSPTGN